MNFIKIINIDFISRLLSKRRYVLLLLALMCGVQTFCAQEYENDNQLLIPPLFEYVVAPDELPDLESRTNFIMENFWGPFDFKNTKFVDQNALNHAMGVYVGAMPFASREKVMEGIRSLIKNIKNNPGLSLQFTKAAEEHLYGPRAEFWADDIYIAFLQNLIDNKKIDAAKKNKYAAQLNLLKRTAVGAKFPDVKFISPSGAPIDFNPSKDFQLIEFTKSDCEDCRYSNLKLDISAVVNDLIDDNKLKVIIVQTDGNLSENAFPDKWLSFSSNNAEEILDIRLWPCFYVIDGKGIIRGKNLNVDDAIGLLEALSKDNN